MNAEGEREKRHEERLHAEADSEGRERRQRMIKLASATAFLAIAVLLVLIVVSQLSTDGGDTDLEHTAEVRAELLGLDQDGLTLGKPGAPVTLVEFGDLQCPACKTYAESIVPEVIGSKVRSGKTKIEFRNYTIIGEESIPAGAAAIAAGEQSHGWNFVELFYRNQGFERSGYVTDEFLTEVAKGAGVPDIERWNADRNSRRVLAEVSKTRAEAEQLGLNSTPSFAVEGPATDGLEPVESSFSAEELEEAIERAG
ncbi:MAG TPA: thioredoxin domain-containing protein [Solirubrobacterales bacterium]|jgi:protein-disulfide isomerase